MAQLRQDYESFVDHDAVIMVVGPDNAKAFADYFGQHKLPFIGLPDPKHSVLKLFGQQVKLFKLGRLPAQVLIDKQGIARFVHYGKNMQDIPQNSVMLSLIDQLNQGATAVESSNE